MGTKGRVPQYSCNMIQLYICMYLYIEYMTHINVKGEITIRIDACSCKLQLYIFGELAEMKNNESQLELKKEQQSVAMTANNNALNLFMW